MNPTKINTFLFFKLPSAWLCGVRLKTITNKQSQVSVRYKWINQNPFKSMYFAVQNMAAELSTGALVMQIIKNQNKKISMLVVKAESKYFKKATGKINFKCEDGLLAQQMITKSIEESSPQVFEMTSKAYNSSYEIVSEFKFTWSVKPKN